MLKEQWIPIIRQACKRYRTPFFLFSGVPIREELDGLTCTCGHSVSHWLSFKTLPLPKLVRWWLRAGLGIEVVSEYELRAARYEGFPPERILVNGVAKHSWKSDCWVDGLRVNFDSIREIEELGSIAKARLWRVGLRFHPSIQTDPENSAYPDQFGIPPDAFAAAYNTLQRYHLYFDTLHLHIRSNLPNSSYYRRALSEIASCLKDIAASPRCLDLGGGLPTRDVTQLDEAWHSNLRPDDVGETLSRCKRLFPSVEEYILENGRYVLGTCGVLVFTVVDTKDINSTRYLICDGGRTNHALPSDWEQHELYTLPQRNEQLVQTVVCGPTCMAYDSLARRRLPRSVTVGDKVIWCNAGAYHLSWENRFSQPLARVLWHDRDGLVEARSAESFNEWWSHGR